MELLKCIVFDILGVTPLLVGFIALIGLLIQRKPIEKVLSGTFKTIVGFMVFAGGAGLAVTSLGNFQTLFGEGFGLKGVMPLAEALTGLAQTKFAMCVSLIMVIGFVWNLFFARITPFKYIFLTGQHNLYLSALLTVTLKALVRSLATMKAPWGTLTPWLMRHPAGLAQKLAIRKILRKS